MTRRPPAQVHILNLAEGDRFRYRPGGDVFAIAVEKGPDGKVARYLARHADGSKCQLWAVVDYAGCFVYPVDPEEESDDAVS